MCIELKQCFKQLTSTCYLRFRGGFVSGVGAAYNQLQLQWHFFHHIVQYPEIIQGRSSPSLAVGSQPVATIGLKINIYIRNSKLGQQK